MPASIKAIMLSVFDIFDFSTFMYKLCLTEQMCKIRAK